MGFERARSAREAQWVEEALREGEFSKVSRVVPARFEAYVAVLYPAWHCVCSQDKANPEHCDVPGEPIRWADVAEAGLPVVYGHAHHSRFGKFWSNRTQYRRLDDGNWIVDELHGVNDLTPLLRPGDEWIAGPWESLQRDLASTLQNLLGPATSTPESCWFGIWEGYGWLSDEQRGGPAISAPGRRWLLYRAPLGELTTSTESIAVRRSTSPFAPLQTGDCWPARITISQPFDVSVVVLDSDNPGEGSAPKEKKAEDVYYQSAELVWPNDRSWCLAPGLDLPCVLIGGSRELVAAIVQEPGLETQVVQPGDGFPSLGDVLKPVVKRPKKLELPPALESRKPPKR